EITKVVSFLGVKKTPFILPFCHNILVEGSDFNFKVNEKFIEIELKVTSVSKTGVEMDALFGVSAGILNIYDMLKFLKKDMKIEIELIYKKGGKSGVYRKS
ncbi:MAG: cyclic pyranopterin monophosphate synthase MoaC, partial [Caldiserica bacterium]